MSNPAVFLDRDGVLCRTFVHNRKSYAPRKLRDFFLMPYTQNSIAQLKQAGFKVIVVTNQPDIGNGFVDLSVVESMHQKLLSKTLIDDVFLCAHRQDEYCKCRKPRPDMLLAAAEKHNIDLSKSYIVGDRASDIEAGHRAGCKTVFIDRHYSEARPEKPETIVHSLQKAVKYILINKSL